VVLLRVPVLISVMVTVALGTTAPLASATAPEMVARNSWAPKFEGNRTAVSATRRVRARQLRGRQKMQAAPWNSSDCLAWERKGGFIECSRNSCC
jgi:hypothetical protein